MGYDTQSKQHMRAELLCSSNVMWVTNIVPAGQERPLGPDLADPSPARPSQAVHARHGPFLPEFILQTHSLSSYLLSPCW